MHDTATPIIASLNPMLLGFIDTSINGHRVITHSGNTVQFHSYLRLFKDDGVGIFLSLNSAGTNYIGVQQDFFEAFADWYFPDTRAKPPIMQVGAARDAALVAGYYRTTYRSESNFLSIIHLLSPTEVVAHDDGSIILNGDSTKRYVHIGPLLWRSEDGKQRFAAALENGAVKWIAGGPAEAIEAFQPFDGATTPVIWRPLGLLALCIVVLGALAWPIAGVIQIAMKQPVRLIGAARTSYHASRLAAALTVAVIGAWMAVYIQLFRLNFPADALVILLQLLLLVVLIALVMSALWYSRTAWLSRRRLGAVFGLLLAGAGSILFWIAANHSFFTFNANY